uniref:Short chain dehydrogenase ausX n=1 Tax=Emericella nidulans (strain FGSC A4 / ATCC 38163 / CBS 112.46 / NRRL 194 / M139) TaxID=227321 RepID=AUSX_EMENI|nr:RecName: Full=Short chain dehydrogenase ausX; AltName: Full=Austinoid biosynthesis cluster protein X [Aspergillus nidulans FGSC A4]
MFIISQYREHRSLSILTQTCTIFRSMQVSSKHENLSVSFHLTPLQVLIITGTSSGIGLAAATMALEEGAKVLGVDISKPPDSLARHANYQFFQADLSHPEAPARVVEACSRTYGDRIDGLLNIAGVMDLNQSADSLSDNVWERCISINLTAPVKLMREVIPIMKLRGKGSIVNVASKAALSGAVSGVAYTASEHPWP